jgi:hypothetical protein
MRKLIAPTVLLLTLSSPVSSAAERKGVAFTRGEICELVEAALTMPYGSELEGLGGNSCVQRNATEQETLLVDVALVSVDGK